MLVFDRSVHILLLSGQSAEFVFAEIKNPCFECNKKLFHCDDFNLVFVHFLLRLENLL